MRKLLTLALTALIAVQTGCAAGARIGTQKTGVGVGASVDVPSPPVWEIRS